MSYSAPQIERVRDNVIRVYHPEPVEPSTYLTADVAAAGTSLTVADNQGFADNDALLIGTYGTETAEIKDENGAVTAGTALTTSALTFAHEKDTPVSKLLFNQFEVSGAATAAGTKTVIATTNIVPSGHYTDYIVSGTTYNYYFVRFKQTYAATAYYSAYTSALIATDFASDTVGFVRRNAFDAVGVTFDNDGYNAEWVYDKIHLCDMDILNEKRDWGALTEYEYDLGDVTTCMARIALPSDIADLKTNRAVMAIRIGKEEGLEYVDWAEFQRIMADVANSPLASAISASDTTVTVDDSNDFEDSGSIMIQEETYDYTGNTRATNTLTGFDAFTDTYAADVDVWQDIDQGTPSRYSIKDGYVYFDIPPDSDLSGFNIWIDYLKKPTKPTDDSDTLLFHDPNVYITWLQLKIKERKHGGVTGVTDPLVKKYAAEKRKIVLLDKGAYKLKMVPRVPC